MCSDKTKHLKDSIKNLNRQALSSKKIICAFDKISNSNAGKEKLYSELKNYVSILEEKCKQYKELTSEQEEIIEELKVNNKRSNLQVRYAYEKRINPMLHHCRIIYAIQKK